MLAQTRIAETIDQFYEESSALSKAGKLYKVAVEKMDEEVRQDLVDCGLIQGPDLPRICA